MKNKKTFKEAFGRNPWDPWSAKAGLAETSEAQLEKYLLSRGINPQYVTKDVKIAHSKSNQFKQWAATHQEEVEHIDEASTALLHRYLTSRGINPLYVSKDTKIAHSKSNQFKQWAATQREEVEQIDELKTGTLMRYSTKANQALIGGDRNKEDRRIQSINRAIQKIKSRYSKPVGDIQVDVKNKKITKNEEVEQINEIGDTKKGQKLLQRVNKRAVDRLVSKRADKDPAYAKKAQQTHLSADERLKEEVELEEGSLHDWFGKEKWVRMDTKGNIKGQCAKEPGEGKPKCLPQAKAHALGKEGRAKAAQRKRREDPNPERSGKAINVRTEETAQIDEKKDACYHKVKSRYKVWPSAYASGALVKCRKAGAKNWGNKSEETDLEEGSVQDKLHTQQQALRKKSGLPHPDYYKELGKSYDISDDKERMAKQSEIKKKYNVESVLYDNPKGTLTRVTERQKEMSRSARIIKALYKKKGVKEDTYDWEKDDKNTSSYGKQPKFAKSDDKASKVKKESDAAAVLSGGTTMTKQKRDIVELDPRMKIRPNKDAQDADDDNKSQ